MGTSESSRVKRLGGGEGGDWEMVVCPVMGWLGDLNIAWSGLRMGLGYMKSCALTVFRWFTRLG